LIFVRRLVEAGDFPDELERGAPDLVRRDGRIEIVTSSLDSHSPPVRRVSGKTRTALLRCAPSAKQGRMPIACLKRNRKTVVERH